MLIASICLLLSIWFLLSIVIWTMRTGISPMPTPPKIKKKLLSLLPEHIPGPVFELGSGWGFLSLSLAKKYPNAQVVGYELSPFPFYFSQLVAYFSKQPNLKFERRDFYNVSLNEAGLIVCYLYPEAMHKLKEKFSTELSKEAIIASHTFAIPGWIPYVAFDMDDLYRTKIYLYRLPRETVDNNII